MLEPLVTINILSYNRKETLRITLQKVFEQDYENIEVIVVDNASPDGAPQMVAEEFPWVKLIRLEKNIGIAGWNRGFESANGEFVLLLDDDSHPEKDAIAEGLKLFKEDESIGIVAFNIFNSTFAFNETNGWSGNLWAFVSCGALIEKKKLEEVGYFDENIFIYLNELELAARFWDAGYKTVFCEKCHVVHSQSLKSRGGAKNPFASKYRYKHFFRSMSYFLLTKFPFPQCCAAFGKWILNRLIVALGFFYPVTFVSEFLRTVFSIPLYLKNRQILSLQTQRFYRYGNFFPLIDRDFFPDFKRER